MWDLHGDSSQVQQGEPGCNEGANGARLRPGETSQDAAGVTVDHERGGIVKGGVFVLRDALAAYLAMLDGETAARLVDGKQGTPAAQTGRIAPPSENEVGQLVSIRRLAAFIGRANSAVQKWRKHEHWPAGIPRNPPWTIAQADELKRWARITLAPDRAVIGAGENPVFEVTYLTPADALVELRKAFPGDFGPARTPVQLTSSKPDR